MRRALPPTIRALGLAALCAVLLPTTACSTPKGLTTAQRIENLQIANADWRAVGYRWDWKVAPTMGQDQSPRMTVASDDLVVFQETGGTVSGIVASRGETIWANRLANPLTQFTGIEVLGDTVAITSQAELFLLNATTGELTDRQRFERLVNTPPLVVGDLVIVGSNSGELMGHFVPAGLKAWGHLMPGVFNEQPVQVGDLVGAVTSRGRVIFVDPISKRQTGLNDIFDGPGAALGSSDTAMFVASLDQSLYAFDPRTAQQIWRHRTPDAVRSAPVYHNGVVYCSFREDGLTALDADTGDVLWNNPARRGEVVGIRNGRLIVHDEDLIAVIDPQRGSELASIDTPNVVQVTTNRFTDGDLYLTSSDGVIARFVPAN